MKTAFRHEPWPQGTMCLLRSCGHKRVSPQAQKHKHIWGHHLELMYTSTLKKQPLGVMIRVGGHHSLTPTQQAEEKLHLKKTLKEGLLSKTMK